MPITRVYFYQDADGRAPVREWLRELRLEDARGHEKCVARIEHLAELGHELRRPEADTLRDGVHELRARRGTVNYRILYFFCLFKGKNAVVLAHALAKGGVVPRADIERALERKARVTRDPMTHLHAD
ncbi:MAG: type II toxin-antitoxin system RelE/ParE family toxin [Planctomycetes bacterium]|nr:type II toxin-antitoxin system RelE/ParE family toxin [Planctomycetota bacterium]